MLRHMCSCTVYPLMQGRGDRLVALGIGNRARDLQLPLMSMADIEAAASRKCFLEVPPFDQHVGRMPSTGFLCGSLYAPDRAFPRARSICEMWRQRHTSRLEFVSRALRCTSSTEPRVRLAKCCIHATASRRSQRVRFATPQSLM